LEREVLLRSTWVALRALDDAIILAGMELLLLEETQRRAQVRHNLGMGSLSEMRTAEFNLAQARIHFATQQTHQRSLQQGLNHLLGEPLQQNTIVLVDAFCSAATDHVTIDPAPELIAAQVTQRINATPTVRSLRLALSIARELDEGVELAEARLDSAIQSMELAWLQAQNDARNLMYQRVLWALELDMANAALEAALIQLELGRITSFDVVRLQYNVSLIENELVAICHRLWLLDFLFTHPALL